METPRVLLVLSTAPSQQVALDVGKKLVDERLAACVNLVGPIRSIYRWQGSIADDTEVLMLIKTRADGLDALRDRLLALHPYSVPEVLAFEAAGGSAAYLAWVLGETGGAPLSG